MLNVLMCVLVSLMAAQADWHGALTWAALALVRAREAVKPWRHSDPAAADSQPGPLA